jgi:hypothetical protein
MKQVPTEFEVMPVSEHKEAYTRLEVAYVELWNAANALLEQRPDAFPSRVWREIAALKSAMTKRADEPPSRGQRAS